MNIVKRRALACLASLGAVGACHAGAVRNQVESLPDIAAPPAGQAFWIARAMRLNGVPMTIKSFATAMNAEQVLQHYDGKLRTSSSIEARWSRQGVWRVLALAAPDHYITIRARDTARGSEGTIAVSPPLRTLTPSQRTRFPHPASARVVNLQEYDDAGIEAEHISMISSRSPEIEAREIASLLTRGGWQLLRHERTAARDGGYVVEAQKDAALARINLRRVAHGHTTITVLWRKA